MVHPFLHLNAMAKGAAGTTGEGPPIEGSGGPLVNLCLPQGAIADAAGGPAAGTATTPTTLLREPVVAAVARPAPKSPAG